MEDKSAFEGDVCTVNFKYQDLPLHSLIKLLISSAVSGGGSSSSDGKGNGHKKNDNNKDSSRRNLRNGARSVSHVNGKQPSFFIGGGNGNWM